jgi:hypothetical protein
MRLAAGELREKQLIRNRKKWSTFFLLAVERHDA